MEKFPVIVLSGKKPISTY